MGVNPELNALQKEVTRQRILEAGFRIFAEKTIDKVTMTDVADAAGIGVATVYRYFSTKPALVLGIGERVWGQYLSEILGQAVDPGRTAAGDYAFFLDCFLELYRNRRDMLRFNQFFNVYVESEEIPPDVLRPYLVMTGRIEEQLRIIYRKGQEDRTLRTDIPPQEFFLTSLHLMLAVVTRYAVGLVVGGGSDPEKELELQKAMLLREFTIPDGARS